MPENNSPPIDTIEKELTKSQLQPQSLQSQLQLEIISTGSPYCLHTHDDSNKSNWISLKCSNRSVPGSMFCGPHGGKLTLRPDGTLGIIGPGAYRAIAQLANLNNRYVSQVLQGKANPTSNVLDKIAKVVGVEIGWLVEYINNQKQIEDD